MRWSSFLGVVVGLLLLGGAGVAAAEPPSRLAGQITDTAGVLAPGDDARITEALTRLRSANGAQVFVVFVDSFDGASGPDWADQTARASQLGRDDVLFAVAVGDRAYGTSVDQGSSLSDGTVSSAERAAEDRLAANDWAGAAIAFSEGLGGGGGGALGVGVLVVGGVAVVGGGAYLLSRRRRSRDAPSAPTAAPVRDEFSDVPTQDLAYQASAGLIEVDEAVRTSEVELSAARGHFGDEAVSGFAGAVEASKADMLRAFGIRQQLDDEVAEDEPTQRRMYADVVRACRAADQRLDEQVAAFDSLRNLEATAPEYLAGLGGRLDAANTRFRQVEDAWAALQGRYAPSALEPVAGHPEQARLLLGVAGTELTAARGELDAGRRSAAVVSGRAAEDALTQAGTLFDGIGRREAELAEAAAGIAAARAETDQDIAEAGALGDALAPVVARAEAAVRAAELAAAGAQPDPIAALRLLDDAGRELDAAIDQAREGRERSRRAAAALQQTLVTARSAVSAASDFVGTRRGAVGPEARTRLAEAERHLQAASAGGDPAAALDEAQQADRLAQEALRLARDDVSRFQAPSGSWESSRGSSAGARIAVDLGSLVLSGILSGAVRGGGSRGRSGGRSPGSFGGSASRGRRGGGGRF